MFPFSAPQVLSKARAPLDNQSSCLRYQQLCSLTCKVAGGLTYLVAVAGDTGRVLPLVEVVPAALAVGTVPVAAAVQAVPAVSRVPVQLLVEEAPVTEAVAVTRCNTNIILRFVHRVIKKPYSKVTANQLTNRAASR